MEEYFDCLLSCLNPIYILPYSLKYPKPDNYFVPQRPFEYQEIGRKTQANEIIVQRTYDFPW